MAGICEHTAAFPLDVVKTRLHRLMPGEGGRYKGVVDACRTMIRTEGGGSFFRGFSVVAFGAGPAHAVYFASYEQSKVRIDACFEYQHAISLCYLRQLPNSIFMVVILKLAMLRPSSFYSVFQMILQTIRTRLQLQGYLRR